MRNNIYVDSFLEIIDSLKKTPQRKDYHPEGDVYTHTAIVWWQASLYLNNNNNSKFFELLYAALFHDLGKIDTLDFHPVYGHPTSYGHENISTRYVDIFGPDIIDTKFDINLVRYIVKNHMKIKNIVRNGLNSNSNDYKELLNEGAEISENAFDLLKVFNKFDDMVSFMDNNNFDLIKDDIINQFTSWLNSKITLLKNKYPEVILNDISNELILIRGCPGSGKTTFSELLYPSVILSTDLYFENENGDYIFDNNELGEAHRWCQEKARYNMSIGTQIVVVNNTFTQLWEMLPYFRSSQVFKYKVNTIIMENRHNSNNIHNVPIKDIKRMKKRFQIKL